MTIRDRIDQLFTGVSVPGRAHVELPIEQREYLVGGDTFPFTGRKDSAEGTLSVSDALRVFSIRTLVAAKGHATNQQILTEIVRGRRSNFLSTDFLF